MLAFLGFNGFGQFDGGDNDSGVSGKQALTFKFIAVDDETPNDKQNMLISCGWSYTAFACGKNLVLQGLLSDKPNSTLNITTSEAIKQIAANDKYCLVLLENGKLYKILPKLDANLVEIQFVEASTTKKRDIFGASKQAEYTKITHIAAGNNLAVAVSSTNAVFSIPSQIFQFAKHERIRQCVCGLEHALILTANGDVYSWGNGIRGQLGVEPLQVHEAPVLVEALAGIKISAIAAGGWHSAAISSFGDVYTWGFNSHGQLGLRLLKANGLKAPSVYPLPQLLDLPPCCSENASENLDSQNDCSPINVLSGTRHIILQMSCGTLLATGWNKHGQLGTSLECLNNCCDSFQKLCLDKNLKSYKTLEIICGPWSTIFKVIKA